MTLRELQQLVAQAVEARGYRQGWTDEQYAARQFAKITEELSEASEVIEWLYHSPGYMSALSDAGRQARYAFDDRRNIWHGVKCIDRAIMAEELVDIVIPALVAADALGIDLGEAIKEKVLADVARGVRGEKPEAQEPEWVLLGSLLPGAPFETEHGERGTIVDGPNKWIGPVKTLGESGRIVEMTPDRWVRIVVAQKQGQWVTLESLRAGAIFETQDGVRAVKQRFHSTGNTCCTLLESGADVSFSNAEPLLVREIVI